MGLLEHTYQVDKCIETQYLRLYDNAVRYFRPERNVTDIACVQRRETN